MIDLCPSWLAGMVSCSNTVQESVRISTCHDLSLGGGVAGGGMFALKICWRWEVGFTNWCDWWEVDS